MVNEWQHLKRPFHEIEVATDNFKTLIGQGGYGRVYKGKLLVSGKETMVAVKRLSELFGQGLKEFLTEIRSLSGQQHPNLISLVGYCDEGEEKTIIYEYAENGSLDQHIKRSGKTTSTTLPWLTRLKICTDAARGLDHLHSHVGADRTIIHRDIKSSNILIDENWVAKISDLGLSKLSGTGSGMSAIVSNGCGTPGYCEPEYYNTAILTKKSDVYSFGVVLFEVLCGRLCLIDRDDGFSLSGISAKEYYKNNTLEKIIDQSLREHMGSNSMTKFAEIAYRCLHDDREKRPAMDVVVKELEKVLEDAKDESFYVDYMLLSPKDVGLWDLIKLLFSKNIGNRKFIDCLDKTVKESFSQRFFIFESIVAQKVLHLVDKPLGWVGSAIEFMPNFKHANGGSFKLLGNVITGKWVLPNKESPEFLSTIGLWDLRRDLDSRINHEDPRYTSALAVMAAKAAYENEAYIKETVEKHWKMEFLGFFNCWNDYEKDYTTQAFMWSDKTGDTELLGVSFRGTSPFNARDLSSEVDLSWYHLHGIGKVHAGFWKALGLQKSNGWPLPDELQTDDPKPYAYYVIRQKLLERIVNNPDAKILVTGHNLGAALAIMLPAILQYHNETDLLKKLEGVYTFGQPRVGDHQFGWYMKGVLETHGIRCQRFVYGNDLVPRMPFDGFDASFKHFGRYHYYNSFYKGQVLTEEPNKNYFSILGLIAMFGNTIWELVRSFIIHFQNGPEYSETFTSRGWRVFRLLIAGLPAHGPQDYVNITRLGSLESFMIASVDQSTNGVNVALATKRE